MNMAHRLLHPPAAPCLHRDTPRGSDSCSLQEALPQHLIRPAKEMNSPEMLGISLHQNGHFIWWLSLPLWKIWVASVGMMTFPIYGKTKAMFQTTNQFMLIIVNSWKLSISLHFNTQKHGMNVSGKDGKKTDWEFNQLNLHPFRNMAFQWGFTKGESFSTVDEDVGFKKPTNSGWPGNDDSYDSRALFAARLNQQKWWFGSVGKGEINKCRDSGGMTMAEWCYCNWYTCRFFFGQSYTKWMVMMTIIDNHWQSLTNIDNHWQSLTIIDNHW